MKYLILSTITITSLISITSCKKNHTCTCTETYKGGLIEYAQITDSTILSQQKKDAEALCEQGNNGWTIDGETYTKTCVLQ